MAFKVKRTDIKVDIYGEEFSLRKPLVQDVEKLQGEMKDLEQDKQLNFMINFMETIGLPKKVSESMELDHFNALTEYVMGSKKS